MSRKDFAPEEGGAWYGKGIDQERGSRGLLPTRLPSCPDRTARYALKTHYSWLVRQTGPPITVQNPADLSSNPGRSWPKERGFVRLIG